jgi:hypothetical protein
MMQLGADGVFVGSGIFKSSNPSVRAKAIVKATTHYQDPAIIAEVSVVKLGKIRVMTFPFEIPLELEIGLKKADRNALVVGYTNGIFGYINTPGGLGYENHRGSLVYNHFPFKTTSFARIFRTAVSMLK